MGPGPASTGDEWIAAGQQGSTLPCHGWAGPSNSLSAEDKDTRGDEGLVLSQCLAARRACSRPGSAGLGERALSGHGCGCAVPHKGSVLAYSGCSRGAAKNFLSSMVPVLPEGDKVVRPARSQLEGMG